MVTPWPRSCPFFQEEMGCAGFPSTDFTHTHIPQQPEGRTNAGNPLTARPSPDGGPGSGTGARGASSRAGRHLPGPRSWQRRPQETWPDRPPCTHRLGFQPPPVGSRTTRLFVRRRRPSETSSRRNTRAKGWRRAASGCRTRFRPRRGSRQAPGAPGAPRWEPGGRRRLPRGHAAGEFRGRDRRRGPASPYPPRAPAPLGAAPEHPVP